MLTGQYRVPETKCTICMFRPESRTISFRAFKPFYMNADAGKADCNSQKGKAPTTSTYCSKWQQKEKRKTNYPVLCKFRFLLKSFLIHKERGDLCVFSF